MKTSLKSIALAVVLCTGLLTLTADAKPQNIRFKLDLNTCGECKRAE